MSFVTRRRSALVGSTVAVAALLAACGSGGSSGSSPSAAASLTGDCAPFSAYAGNSGKSVSIFASIIQPESDKYIKSWSKFEECTGIKINYEGTNEFESQLNVRVAGGTPPDIAFIPQPGLLQKMVGTGKVVKPPQGVVDNVANWNAKWKDYGSVDGTFYAAPMSSNMKSLVWYNPTAFKAAGYTVPKTWDELTQLSDKIAATGAKPWCGGIGSGTATGWPATDWLEEIVMRNNGPDVYDKWISHEVKFSSPEIKSSMDILEKWMKNPKYVNGGFGDVKTIASTTFQDAANKSGIPTGQKDKCWLLQQASFIANQFPAGTKIAEDGNAFAFYMPPTNDKYGKPVEGGGEFVTAFRDAPEVQAVQTYLSTVEWINEKIKLGDWVSGNSKADKSLYTNPIDRLSADLLTDPSASFRFDASDLMPAAVGAGAFWKEMTAWFAPGKPTDQVLSAIDAAWPTG